MNDDQELVIKDIYSCTVLELKEKLKKRGQNRIGTKAKLIDRLMLVRRMRGGKGGAFGMDIIGVGANETHVDVIENCIPREAADRKQILILREARLQHREKELALRKLKSARQKIDQLCLALETGTVAVRPAEALQKSRDRMRNASLP